MKRNNPSSPPNLFRKRSTSKSSPTIDDENLDGGGSDICMSPLVGGENDGGGDNRRSTVARGGSGVFTAGMGGSDQVIKQNRSQHVVGGGVQTSSSIVQNSKKSTSNRKTMNTFVGGSGGGGSTGSIRFSGVQGNTHNIRPTRITYNNVTNIALSTENHQSHRTIGDDDGGVVHRSYATAAASSLLTRPSTSENLQSHRTIGNVGGEDRSYATALTRTSTSVVSVITPSTGQRNSTTTNNAREKQIQELLQTELELSSPKVLQIHIPTNTQVILV
jgi:hypothetical protein